LPSSSSTNALCSAASTTGQYVPFINCLYFLNLLLQFNFPTWSPPSLNANWNGCPQTFPPRAMFGVQRQEHGFPPPVILSCRPPVTSKAVPQKVHNSLVPIQVLNTTAIKVSFNINFEIVHRSQLKIYHFLELTSCNIRGFWPGSEIVPCIEG
jgi:hypothetical protein